MNARAALLAVVVALFAGCSAAPSAQAAMIPDYEREAFGSGWADLDGDCQDTRNEILIRDLDGERLDRAGCKVLSGTLVDSYTGTTIEFVRGQTTSDDVQIDHVIPLHRAWQAGAWAWTPEQREAFSNDPANLRAVDGPTNNRKGDRGPGRWLPPNRGVHCAYAAGWQDVAQSYRLALEPADAAAVAAILDRPECTTGV